MIDCIPARIMSHQTTSISDARRKTWLAERAEDGVWFHLLVGSGYRAALEIKLASALRDLREADRVVKEGAELLRGAVCVGPGPRGVGVVLLDPLGLLHVRKEVE